MWNMCVGVFVCTKLCEMIKKQKRKEETTNQQL